MALVNMRYSETEAKEMKEPTVIADRPQYPYGLCIRLDEEALDKLGIQLPEVGSEMSIQAVATVQSVSSNESIDGEPHRCVELQITDLAVMPYQKKKDPAEAIYGA